MSQKSIDLEKSYILNQQRVSAAIKKYDKLCQIKQAYDTYPTEDRCNCTKIQGQWNCKFNNW